MGFPNFWKLNSIWKYGWLVNHTLNIPRKHNMFEAKSQNCFFLGFAVFPHDGLVPAVWNAD